MHVVSINSMFEVRHRFRRVPHHISSAYHPRYLAPFASGLCLDGAEGIKIGNRHDFCLERQVYFPLSFIKREGKGCSLTPITLVNGPPILLRDASQDIIPVVLQQGRD